MKGGPPGARVAHRCSKQGVLQWTRQLVMRTHPWPHRDDADSGIVEGGPRRGVTTPTVVLRATGVVALAFPFSLTLTLSFATIVEGEGRG
jgi:hypothetical protein